MGLLNEISRGGSARCSSSTASAKQWKRYSFISCLKLYHIFSWPSTIFIHRHTRATYASVHHDAGASCDPALRGEAMKPAALHHTRHHDTSYRPILTSMLTQAYTHSMNYMRHKRYIFVTVRSVARFPVYESS